MASRPMTAGVQPPSTTGSEAFSDGYDSEPEDANMFAFAPPNAADEAARSPHESPSDFQQRSHNVQTTTQSAFRPQSSGQYPISDQPPFVYASDSDVGHRLDTGMTAETEMSDLGGPSGGHLDQNGQWKGPRRVSNDSDDYSRAQSRGQYGSQWEDQARSDTGTSSSYGIDENGNPIQGVHGGHHGAHQHHHPTREEDQKMVEQYEAEMEELNLPGYDLEDDDEDSPYPEVRASVSNYDDTEMPVLTFRAWFLGLFFAVLVGGLNSFLTFRYPAPLVTPIIIQVVAYPCGKFLAWLLPITSRRVPKFLVKRGWDEECSLNPGPFNIKEHTIIVIMGNVASSQSSAIAVTTALDKFYGYSRGVGFDIMIVLTGQMIGFGLAGLTRRFLVWPASLIWPQNLVFCTLLNTLHAEDDSIDEGGGMSRYRFFVWVACGSFAYFFLPGFLFQALSAFSFVCWAAPNNRVVNQLFGVNSGLGMGMFTFDWSQISYISSPLVVPWWAEVNIFVGFVITFWIVAPIMYYKNVLFSAYLPMSTSQVFDRFGMPYDSSRVIDPVNMALNSTAYAEYSPLYLPITYTALYALAFALPTSLIIHTTLYHGKEIKDRIFNSHKEKKDIHYKLMSVYKEVPEWWYLLYLAIFVAISIGVVVRWEVETPVWALIVSMMVGFIYVIPGGYIYAMTAQEISVNLMVELMAGYALPGKALANMIFKTYSLQIIACALTFTQDLKLGHYMKLPPRATFITQLVATFLSCLAQVGVKEWLTASVPDLCDPMQAANLVCPYASVTYSASITWGLIGPKLQFGEDTMYNPLLYSMLAGALLPIPFWLAGLKWPQHKWIKLISIPVLLSGATYMPPATGINYSSWFFVGFLFQYLARRRYFRWWSKFNFVLSAGLDCGTVLCTLFIFVTLQLPKNGAIAVNWWGNRVFTETADWAGLPYLDTPEEGFGPTSWAS